MEHAPKALEGVRVLDLSRVLAGPWATQILGDLGAEVIKVEKPGAGDDTRAWGPPFVDGGDAAYFLAANRNKRSITVDFTKPEGAGLIARMVARSHILVENYKTGGLAKYGLDYPTLQKVNPALVYCSITGFGQQGPYAAKSGYDYLIQAMGGLMSITGQPDGAPGAEPMKVGVAVADLFTGMYAVTGILAALRHAERTGEGQQIDIALLDCQLAMLANQAMNHFVSGVAPARLGNAHPNIAPYQVFKSKDGHLVLAVGNDGQFKSFCRVAGRPDLAEDPRFATNAFRVKYREALIPEVAAAIVRHPTAHWLAALDEAGVACGPINTIAQAFADPHVAARAVAHVMTRDNGDEVTLVASPLRLSRTPPVADHAPPILSHDTDAVLREVLAATPAQIKALRAKGVV